MNKLVYVIYDYYSKEKLFFLETDGKKNIISENEINNFPRVQKSFFLISDLFNSFEIKLPDTSLANQKKALPFLIEDQLVDDGENYSKYLNNKEGILLLAKKNNLEELIKNIDLFSTSSLQPIEASFEEDKLIIIRDKVIVALNKKWYWSGNLEIFESYLPYLEEYSKNQPIQCHVLEKIPESLKSKNFLKFKLHKDIQSLWSENMPDIKKEINILKGVFEPKIDWLNKFKEWKILFYTGIAVYSIFLLSALIQISALSISNYQFKNQLSGIFNEKFPNETLKNDLISQVNNLVNINSFTKKNLDLLELIANEISIMDNISLISINSDSNKLSIDVEAIDYQEIENLVRLMANSGVDISIGSSRRSNNLLIGELDVENF